MLYNAGCLLDRKSIFLFQVLKFLQHHGLHELPHKRPLGLHTNIPSNLRWRNASLRIFAPFVEGSDSGATKIASLDIDGVFWNLPEDDWFDLCPTPKKM